MVLPLLPGHRLAVFLFVSPARAVHLVLALDDRPEVLLGPLGTVDEPVQIGRPEPEPDAWDTVEDDPPFRAEAIEAARMNLQDLGRLPDGEQTSPIIVHGFPLAAGLDKAGAPCHK